MIKARLSQLRQRLQAIHAEMAQLLPAFLGREPLLPAYLRYQPRTCGSPGCRCAKGDLHPAWIAQFAAGGRSHCRSVSKKKYEALAVPAQAYRRFRSARARWNRLAREANAVLKEIEQCRKLDAQSALKTH
jgi:hypothetical protein